MERHCCERSHIAASSPASGSWAIDGELLTVAAILHDIGLYPGISRGGVYTPTARRLARELLPAHGWRPERIERCADAIDRHHELRNQHARGGEVEALRLADLVELSGGLLRFGVDRSLAARALRRGPRSGLVGELAREVGHGAERAAADDAADLLALVAVGDLDGQDVPRHRREHRDRPRDGASAGRARRERRASHRDPAAKTQPVIDAIAAETGAGDRLRFAALDLGDLDSVRAVRGRVPARRSSHCTG